MKDDKSSAVDLSAPPTSFTAFKPLGHIVIGFPDDETCERASQALKEAGIQRVQHVASNDMRLRMAQMLDLASGSAEFGHEVVEMRRYLSLSAEGYGWLIVPASSDEASRHVVSIVEPLGARIAVHYGALIITDLL